MPEPKQGESEADYVARFMKSAEAQADFPDEKQRLAVAYSLYKKRDKVKNAAESPWPRLAEANHLETGVVLYRDMEDPHTKQKRDVMLLVTREAIEKMRPSFVGKPVVNREHKDVIPSFLEDGIVVGGYWNAELGKDMVQYLVWDEETKDAVKAGSGVSCAYFPKVDWTPGTWHNVSYDGIVLDGEYEHLAVVANPRYEDSASRLLNSNKGGVPTMLKMILEKLGIKNSVEVDGGKTLINLNGKDVPLADMVASHQAEENRKLANAVAGDDAAMVDVGGGKMVSVKDLKAAHLKNEAEKEKEKMNYNETDEEKEKRLKKEKAENEAKEEKDKEEKMKNSAAVAAADKAAFERLRNASQSRSAVPEYQQPDSESSSLERGADMFGMAAK